MDTTPDTFDFTDITGATGSMAYESSKRVLGFVGPSTASVTSGTAEVRVNGGGSWATSVDVHPGDILNIRMTTGAGSGAVTSATVTIGTSEVDWNITNAP